MKSSRAVLVLLAASLAFTSPPTAPIALEGMHPLDPLTRREISAVVQTLRKGRQVNLSSRFPLITLEEPPKQQVLGWKPGDPVERKAFAIVKRRQRVYEAVVDATQRELLSWKQIEGVQPSVLLTEDGAVARQLVMTHPDWQAAVRSRGITDLGTVICTPLTVGNFGREERARRRLVKVICFNPQGASNYWGRPIEGLVTVVDLDQRVVVEVIDTGAVVSPDSPVDFDPGSVGEPREPLHPIQTLQPQGPSFIVDGHTVSWQKWRFHFRIDPRLGPVISTVTYDDGGRRRSVLYQGSLSELFVPYMSPDTGWYFRTFMDAGEYGIGKLAAPLQPNLDCPATAVFLDATFADDWGGPYSRERVACLFERSAGDIAWRHYEALGDSSEVRQRTDLVARFVAAVGNYDYILDWVFRQDGTIQVDLGASGVAAVKAVASRTIADDPEGRDTAHGRMVAEHTVAIHHDHFFCFRLDLDVDGQENSFLRERLQTRRLDTDSPRKSVWVVEPSIAETEQAARMRIDLEQPALWRLINPKVLGPLGYPVSYQVQPRTNALSLLSPDDAPQQRAGFTDYHLWVTPHDRGERYATGLYPNQSAG